MTSLSDLACVMEGAIPSAEELRALAEELADARIEAAIGEHGACAGDDATTGQPCCPWSGHRGDGWPEHLDAARWWRGERP